VKLAEERRAENETLRDLWRDTDAVERMIANRRRLEGSG
jgi:hypothetical protein